MEEDSDELVYDSEEEARAEEEFQKEKKARAKDQEEKKEIQVNDENSYDIDAEIKKSQKYKVADGVKFVEYDELGLPKNDGFNYRDFITTDTKELDTVIAAPPDAMEAALRPKGVRHDQDKPVADMNEEGKLKRFRNQILLGV